MANKDPENSIFVCTRSKGCGAYGAKRLIRDLREEIGERSDLEDRVEVYQCQCLGLCSKGIAVAVFPQNRFIKGLHKKEAKKVLKKAFTDRKQHTELRQLDLLRLRERQTE